MIWFMLLSLAVLAGVAFGWIVVRTSRERITVSLELVKIAPALRKVAASAASLMHRDHDFDERHSSH
ncbi:MAG: hypothetical protein HY290_02215 [Planctomycetia bacterium]|nr:hypothetical protein [Planctomycetia bacterium]